MSVFKIKPKVKVWRDEQGEPQLYAGVSGSSTWEDFFGWIAGIFGGGKAKPAAASASALQVADGELIDAAIPALPPADPVLRNPGEFSAREIATLNAWVNAIETGDPRGDYGKVTLYKDGPGGVRQITYGRAQTTEAGDNLKALVRDYFRRGGKENALRAILERPRYALAAAMPQPLTAAMRQAGKEPAMRDAQDALFSERYLAPALAFCAREGLRLPLSALVAFDSYIQSGGVPSFLRRRFAELTPAGANAKRPEDQAMIEMEWTRAYVATRHQWLANWGDGKSEKSRLLRASSYRTRDLNREIANRNWNLNPAGMLANGILVSDGLTTLA